jgi:hypothetical protein
MSVAKFTVQAQLDGAGGAKKGTVSIDRTTGLVTVRPSRSRSTYTAKLADIADLIVKKALMAGAAEMFSPKKAARRR